MLKILMLIFYIKVISFVLVWLRRIEIIFGLILWLVIYFIKYDYMYYICVIWFSIYGGGGVGLLWIIKRLYVN